MAVIRVPYPREPEKRRAALDRAMGLLERFGSHEGTTEAGSFHGSTPIGGFAGSYRSLDESNELEIELTKKPWLVSAARIESEIRKFLEHT
jgi:hypothetical protein